MVDDMRNNLVTLVAITVLVGCVLPMSAKNVSLHDALCANVPHAGEQPQTFPVDQIKTSKDVVDALLDSVNQMKSPPDIPFVVPDGLTELEYLILADRYADMRWPEQASDCIHRIEQSNCSTDIKERAHQIQRTKLPREMPPHQAIDLASKAEHWSKDLDDSARRRMLEDGIKQYPNCEYLYDSLCKLLTHKDPIAAQAAGLKAIEINPNFVHAYDSLARVQQARHDRRAEIRYWQAALNLDPNDEYARYGLERNSLVSEAVSQAKLLGGILPQTLLALPKSGYIDKSGKLLFRRLHTGVETRYFSDGLLRTGIGDCHFVNKAGAVAFDRKFRIAEDFSEGLAAVFSDQKWGFIDTAGKFVISPAFDDVRSFHEGLAAAKSGRKWGYINKLGEWVISAQFDDANNFSHGRAAVLVNAKVGYIDQSGRVMIPAQYDAGWSFSEGLARVVNYETPIYRQHSRYLDKNGNVVFEPLDVYRSLSKTQPNVHGKLPRPFGKVHPIGVCDDSLLTAHQINVHPDDSRMDDRFDQQYHDGRLLFHIDGLVGYLDATGHLAIPNKFTDAEAFHEGLAAVSLDYDRSKEADKKQSASYGFIDPSGNFVIPPKYSVVHNFHEGLAFVKSKDGKIGFIDKSGAMVLPLKTGDAGDFHDGVASVGPEVIDIRLLAP